MIFCVASITSCGCTFLDWSIHYLAGHDKFFSIDSGWLDLSSNPIKKLNAHGHKKNHPAGYNQTLFTIDRLQQEGADLSSLYAATLNIAGMIDGVGTDLDQLPEKISEVMQYGLQDFSKIWQLCAERKVPLIFLDCQDPVYNWNWRGQERTPITNQINHSAKDALCDMMTHFFPDQQQQWNKNGSLDSIWDFREFVALNVDLSHKKDPIDGVAFNYPHLWIKAQEFWFNNSVIHRVMDYLELTIDPDRLQTWMPIYYDWRQVQAQSMQFSWALDHICNSIVNNYPLDLLPYNLTLVQEAVIQHVMIYKHNLNFKTWQLERFPDNTQDLHKLLEPNTHTIRDIYGTL